MDMAVGFANAAWPSRDDTCFPVDVDGPASADTARSMAVPVAPQSAMADDWWEQQLTVVVDNVCDDAITMMRRFQCRRSMDLFEPAGSRCILYYCVTVY